ncbi:MAG: signal peptidase I [Bdellovibrionales bacterium]
MSATDAQRKQWSFVLRSALQAMGLIVIPGLLIRAFFVSSFYMAGSSMLPSVWPGDFMVAVKWKPERVHRGDIVVIKCPGAEDSSCLKRVVGLPGDRVEITNHKLFINGQETMAERLTEELGVERVQGQSWTIWVSPLPLDDLSPLIVPPGHAFLLNDKREIGEDSRLWGPVPIPTITAKAKTIWFSLDWFDGEQVREWPRVRWSRILRSAN